MRNNKKNNINEDMEVRRNKNNQSYNGVRDNGEAKEKKWREK
jgi:hypothetical protein